MIIWTCEVMGRKESVFELKQYIKWLQNKKLEVGSLSKQFKLDSLGFLIP